MITTNNKIKGRKPSGPMLLPQLKTMGAAPVARAPYRLAPSEMLELSNQLQELVDREMDFRSFMVDGIADEFHLNDELYLNDVSLEKGIVDEAERLRKSSKARGKRKQVTGPTVKEALHSDPDIYEFPSAMELKDFVDCHFVVAHTRRLMSALQKQELLVMLSGKGKLRKTRPKMTLERKCNDAFLSVVMRRVCWFPDLSRRPYSMASDELAIASYPFITEAFANLYASLEELLLKKPRSHRSKFASSQSGPLSSKTLIN
ncbi:hypothetical protein Tco_1540058 [Tanacetum coccineum]